jgi:hypothetical protein
MFRAICLLLEKKYISRKSWLHLDRIESVEFMLSVVNATLSGAEGPS